MKNKKVILGLFAVLLTSCGTRLTDPQIPQLHEFKDENLNRAIRVGEQDKKEIKDDVKNLLMEQYVPVMMDGQLVEYSKEFAIENGVYAPVYYDFENKYLETHILNYTLALQKVGNEFVKNGSYFDLVGDIFDDEYCEYIFEYGVTGIYSWEILDFVKMMTIPQADLSMNFAGINVSQTSSEQKFYHNLTCVRDDGNGNFEVSVSGDISYVVTEQLSTNLGGEEMSIEYKSTVKTDKIDIVYKDHKVSEFLVHTTVTQDDVYDNDGNVIGNGYVHDYVLYTAYQYNVGEDVFKPSFLQ